MRHALISAVLASSACFSANPDADQATDGGTTTQDAGTASSLTSSGSSAVTTASASSSSNETGQLPTTSSGSTDTGASTETSAGSDPGSTSETTTSTGEDSSSGETEPTAVFFLNFEGPTLFEGATDDARVDQTAVAIVAQDYQPYGDAEEEQDLLDRVREDFEAVNVLVTDERPVSGDYTMVVVSPTNPVGVGVFTYGSGVDCSNSNANNIAFAFVGATTNLPPTTQANLISSIIGLSVGMERITNEAANDVMHQFVQGANGSFVDACLDLRDSPAQCPIQHQTHCPDGQQNSFAELETFFGPA